MSDLSVSNLSLFFVSFSRTWTGMRDEDCMGIKEAGQDWWRLRRTGGGCRGQEKDKKRSRG